MALTITQAKEIMIKKGWDVPKIDWDSYSNDIDMQEWLLNEYGYIIKSNTQEFNEAKAAFEMAEAYYRKEEPYQPSLSVFNDEIIQEPIKNEEIQPQQHEKPLIIKLEYPEPIFNVTFGSQNRKELIKIRLSKGINQFIQRIRQKITERQRFLEWNDYINKVLIPNIEVEVKDIGNLEVW